MWRELLAKLNRELLVLDWKQRQTTRAAVQVTIEDVLDAGLPDVYGPDLYASKSAAVFGHVYSAHQGAGISVYSTAAQSFRNSQPELVGPELTSRERHLRVPPIQRDRLSP